MFVGAMTLASCSSDENVLEEKQQQEQLNGVPMKISLGASGVTSRLALTDLADKDTNFKFEEGDKIYVFKTDGTYLGCLEMEDTRNDNTEAQFVGSDSDGKGIDVVDGQEVIIWYFGTEGIDESTLKVGQKMSTLDYDLSLQTNGTSSKNAANAKMKVKFVTEKNPDGTDHLWATNAETVTLSHIFAVSTVNLFAGEKSQEESSFKSLGVKRVLVTGSYNQVTLDLTKVATASVTPIVAGSEKYGNIIVNKLADGIEKEHMAGNELRFFVVPGKFSPVFTYAVSLGQYYYGSLSTTTLKAGDIIRSNYDSGLGYAKIVEMRFNTGLGEAGTDGKRNIIERAGYRCYEEKILPDLLVAAANLGAGSDQMAGDLLAFGEIYPKSEYTPENYLYKTESMGTSSQKDIEYVKTSSENYLYILAPGYDAAQVRMKGGWRMPTKQEMEAIFAKLKLDDYQIAPTAIGINEGFYLSDYVWFALENETDKFVSYWTSTFDQEIFVYPSFNGRSDHARTFTIRKNPFDIANNTRARYEGHQIRPVFDESIIKSHPGD